MSELLSLGLSLEQVIERTTIRPAQLFDYGLELGTLRPGREADISIFQVGEGKFSFSDMDGQHRTGRQKLFPAGVVRSGRAIEIMSLNPS
jgi:dihydroorotase